MPADIEALETRLSALEDRERIWELMMEYRRHLDQRDFAAYSRLFTEDGEWVGNLGIARGPAEIEAPRCETLEEIVQHRADHLRTYQSADYAERYRALVERVRQVDSGEDKALSRAVARYYAKLLAYKDEYEVARLYSDDAFRKQLEAQFEGDYHLEFYLAPSWLAKPDPRTLYWLGPGGNSLALRHGDLVLIRQKGKPDELYDLAADPGQKKDLAANRPDALAALERLLKQAAARDNDAKVAP